MTAGVTIVKCGGAAGIDRGHVCADVAALISAGERVVLVHGGSADIDALAARLGVTSRSLTSPSGVSNRHTSPEMMEVVTMALVGKVKPELIRTLHALGVQAVGLTGADAGLVLADRKRARRAVSHGRTFVIHDDHSGRIATVAPELLTTLLHADFVPVVSPPVLDAEAKLVNVDADRLAAAIACALSACQLILLTSRPGVLADETDAASVLATLALPPTGVENLPATAGMRLKLIAAREALLGGVGKVIIADGRVADPIRAARAGHGTRVVLDAHVAAGARP